MNKQCTYMHKFGPMTNMTCQRDKGHAGQHVGLSKYRPCDNTEWFDNGIRETEPTPNTMAIAEAAAKLAACNPTLTPMDALDMILKIIHAEQTNGMA